MKSLRILLLPCSFLFWLVTKARNWFFDIGILRVTQLNVPVLSIGNISTGGTGKTPFVELLVRKLQSKGRRPAVVSRGYGRRTNGFLLVSGGGEINASASDAGDEPFQLAAKLKGTVVAVGEKRVDAARQVLAQTSADCIVLDDGFQHRYLHRDLNIVLLTARELNETQWLLPAGNRREGLSSLRRADVIVISKCKDVGEHEVAKRRLPDRGTKRIAAFHLSPALLRNAATGECLDRNAVRNIAVMIFSGLGDPESFRQSVEEFGCTVIHKIDFPDHHWYSSADLTRIKSEFAERKAKFLVTTEKDVVRLRSLEDDGEEFFKTVPVYVLEVNPEFIAGEEVIDELIDEAIR